MLYEEALKDVFIYNEFDSAYHSVKWENFWNICSNNESKIAHNCILCSSVINIVNMETSNHQLLVLYECMQNRHQSTIHSQVLGYSACILNKWQGDGHMFYLSYYGASENWSLILKDKSMYCRQLILHFTNSCSEVILPFGKFVRVCVWLCACHNKTGIVWGNEDALKSYLFFFAMTGKQKWNCQYLRLNLNHLNIQG